MNGIMTARMVLCVLALGAATAGCKSQRRSHQPRPVGGTTVPAGASIQGIVGHTAVRLANGEIVVLGGTTRDAQAVATAERYDPGEHTYVLPGADRELDSTIARVERGGRRPSAPPRWLSEKRALERDSSPVEAKVPNSYHRPP